MSFAFAVTISERVDTPSPMVEEKGHRLRTAAPTFVDQRCKERLEQATFRFPPIRFPSAVPTLELVHTPVVATDKDLFKAG